MGTVSGGGNDGVRGRGWTRTRATFGELWQGNAIEWSEERSEQLFAGIMSRLESRRRRRRLMRFAITCAGVAVTLLIGFGLVGFGVNGPFAHLWSRVQTGWWPTT